MKFAICDLRFAIACLVLVSGSAWGAETWTLDEATSMVSCSDGSDVDGSRCDLDGLYLADRAGTRTVLDFTAAAAVTTTTLDSQLTPCERGELTVTWACTPKGGATMDVTGTDGYGDALSLSAIDISAGGPTALTRKFGTITQVVVNGVDVASTLTLTQDQWGALFKVSDGMWIIEPGFTLELGDGAEGYFESLNESVYLSDGVAFDVKDNMTALWGEASGGYGINGSWWSVGAGATLDVIAAGETGASAEFYASTLHNRSDNLLRFMDGTVTARNATFSGPGSDAVTASVVLGGATDMDETAFSSWKTVELEAAAGTFTNVTMRDVATGLTFDSVAGSVSGLTITGETEDAEVIGSVAGTLVDLVSDVAAATVASGGSLVEANTFNLTVRNRLGTALEGARVVLLEADGDEAFAVATDSAGAIAEQTVTYKTWTDSGAAAHGPFVLKITPSGGSSRAYVVRGIALDDPTTWEIEVGTLSGEVGVNGVGGGAGELYINGRRYVE